LEKYFALKATPGAKNLRAQIMELFGEPQRGGIGKSTLRLECRDPCPTLFGQKCKVGSSCGLGATPLQIVGLWGCHFFGQPPIA
jgi:hypothetical protein